jgi:uncharacterized protein with von Willebrand factor type A (vWA) domain
MMMMNGSSSTASELAPATNGLFRTVVLFARLLRRGGLAVSTTQTGDFVQALLLIDLQRREDWLGCGEAIFVRRPEELPRFRRIFAHFWRRHAPPVAHMDLAGRMRRAVQERQAAGDRDGVKEEAATSDGGEEGNETLRLRTYSRHAQLRQMPFEQMSPAELAAVHVMMEQLRWRIRPRRSRRHRPTRSGRNIDLRRTFHEAVRHGGRLYLPARRQRQERERPLVLLCDVSGSMARYSRLLLQFIFAVTRRLDRVESFVFGTKLDRITGLLRRRSVEQALTQVSAGMAEWGGGTRIGESLHTFNHGEPARLAHEMARLHHSAWRLLWLNPLLGDAGYQPLVQGMQAALPHVDHFLPLHNFTALEQLTAVLAQLGHLPRRLPPPVRPINFP